MDLWVENSVSEENATSIFSSEDGYVSPKRWYLPTSPHGVTAQKTTTDILRS
jgi:hypothetical protein